MVVVEQVEEQVEEGLDGDHNSGPCKEGEEGLKRCAQRIYTYIYVFVLGFEG